MARNFIEMIQIKNFSCESIIVMQYIIEPISLMHVVDLLLFYLISLV